MIEIGPNHYNIASQGTSNRLFAHVVEVPAGRIDVEPQVPDYAALPIEEAFDWTEIVGSARNLRQLADSPLYLVAFRSTLKAGADTATLHEHDRQAHEAALESPDLIHYFGGIPDDEGQALSFCLWQDAEAARAISKDRRHTDAMAMVGAYEFYSIEKYFVHHTDGEVRLEVLA